VCDVELAGVRELCLLLGGHPCEGGGERALVTVVGDGAGDGVAVRTAVEGARGDRTEAVRVLGPEEHLELVRRRPGAGDAPTDDADAAAGDGGTSGDRDIGDRHPINTGAAADLHHVTRPDHRGEDVPAEVVVELVGPVVGRSLRRAHDYPVALQLDADGLAGDEPLGADRALVLEDKDRVRGVHDGLGRHGDPSGTHCAAETGQTEDAGQAPRSAVLAPPDRLTRGACVDMCSRHRVIPPDLFGCRSADRPNLEGDARASNRCKTVYTRLFAHRRPSELPGPGYELTRESHAVRTPTPPEPPLKLDA
jgi:hypothetical protein